MSKACRNFTADQKAEVVLGHFRNRVSVGDLAAELDLQPSQIHQGVDALLAQADRGFQNKPDRRRQAPEVKRHEVSQRQVKRLEERLQLKNEVISDLMEENLKAKKANGDL